MNNLLLFRTASVLFFCFLLSTTALSQQLNLANLINISDHCVIGEAVSEEDSLIYVYISNSFDSTLYGDTIAIEKTIHSIKDLSKTNTLPSLSFLFLSKNIFNNNYVYSTQRSKCIFMIEGGVINYKNKDFEATDFFKTVVEIKTQLPALHKHFKGEERNKKIIRKLKNKSKLHRIIIKEEKSSWRN